MLLEYTPRSHAKYVRDRTPFSVCAERSMISPKLRGKPAMQHYPRNFEPNILMMRVLRAMCRTRYLLRLYTEGNDFKPKNFYEYVLKCRAEFRAQKFYF